MAPTSRKVPKPRKVKLNHVQNDGWSNVLTGLGVFNKDKRLGANYAVDQIDQASAEQLWRGDHIVARIVETIPNEMLREGFECAIEDDKEMSEEMDAAARDLNVTETARTAMNYARAYGGAGIMLGVDDGATDLSKPLNENNIKSFGWMTVLSPRELQAHTYYGDPRKARYGEVESYRLCPLTWVPGSPTDTLTVIHESRLVRVGGVHTSRQSTLYNIMPGWDDSILNRCAQVVNDYQAAWQGAAILIQDFSVPTLKIKGLAKVLAMKNTNDRSIQVRAAAMQSGMGICKVAILDSEEEFKRETTTVTGLSDLLEKLTLHLASAAGIPVSLLMGQAPAGLNATGDSDIRWFYDQVSAMQERILRPMLKRIFKLMFLDKSRGYGGEPENWDVRFNPMWQLTEAETAALRLQVAQADVAYITAQVATPEEIAMSRFGGDGYSIETQIDTEARDRMMTETPADEKFAAETKAEADAAKMKAEAMAKGPAGKPAGKPFAKADDADLLPFMRADFDPDQPRATNGEWGEGGTAGGGSESGGGASNSNAEKGRAVARPFRTEKAQKLHEMMQARMAKLPPHELKSDPEYMAAAKELKARGITTFAKLAAANARGE